MHYFRQIRVKDYPCPLCFTVMIPTLQPVATRLLIVDDHRLFAEGIRFLIEQAVGYDVVGVVHSGREVIPFLERHLVDMVLLDIELPDLSGFDLAKSVRALYPTLKILALSMRDDKQSFNRIRDAGATGYCCKSAGRDELFGAIRAVSEGNQYWSPPYIGLLKQETTDPEPHGLTNREQEIIRLIASGVSTRNIASALFLSTRTVETHRKNIYRKLGVHTNVELTLCARKMSLI